MYLSLLSANKIKNVSAYDLLCMAWHISNIICKSADHMRQQKKISLNFFVFVV